MWIKKACWMNEWIKMCVNVTNMMLWLKVIKIPQEIRILKAKGWRTFLVNSDELKAFLWFFSCNFKKEGNFWEI